MEKTNEVFCSRIELKPGSLPLVREWVRTMTDRKTEALAALANEKVFEEVVFLESSPSGDYLVVFMRAEDMQYARRVGRSSTEAIDEYHRQFKQDVIETSKELKLLLDFERF